MSSQIGTSRAYGWADETRREPSEGSPRDRVARLLRDPKGYFAEARRWAGNKAKADVQRELTEKQERREHRSTLRRALGLT
ncbi:MAG TPA: hypothetical protein VGN37_28245 [Actinocatenispora sp.]